MWVRERLFINICIDFTSNLRLSKKSFLGGLGGPQVCILFESIAMSFRL